MQNEEIEGLERILSTGTANGVELQMITAVEARKLEPNVPAVAALLSPNTGIVNAHGVMDYFLHRAIDAGAILQTEAELVGLERQTGAYRLTLSTPDGPESFTSERVVNAAGRDCDTVAALLGIETEAAGYRIHFCKGSYFAVSARKAGIVSRLVYPVPSTVSLGVHALPDLNGRLKFGPDAEYLDERIQDYRVDESKRSAFAASVRRLVPSIQDEDLTPDMSGIRPKIQKQGEPPRDFVIGEETQRGFPGLYDLIGIESPGLTASPAIADYVAELMGL